jgi:hypothetical protein
MAPTDGVLACSTTVGATLRKGQLSVHACGWRPPEKHRPLDVEAVVFLVLHTWTNGGQRSARIRLASRPAPRDLFLHRWDRRKERLVPPVSRASLTLPCKRSRGGINQREEPGEARVMNRIVRPARQSKFVRELLRNVRGASDALSVGGERTRIRGISLQPYPSSAPPISYSTTTSTRRRRVPRLSERNYNRPVLVRYLRKAHKRPFVGEFRRILKSERPWRTAPDHRPQRRSTHQKYPEEE